MNLLKFICCNLLLTIAASSLTAQLVDTTGLLLQPDEKAYDAGNGKIFIYARPKRWDFLKALPKDARAITVAPFTKQGVRPLFLVAASTGLLMLLDEPIANTVQKWSNKIGLDPAEKNVTVWEMKIGKKSTTLLKAPGNINTAFYQLGQGFPWLLLGAGLYVGGRINHNYRSVSTASQLTESFILMAVYTQVLKRISGRESPVAGNENAGKWKLFPSFKDFQNNTSHYDAFPSGHLATLMSSITILAENYPEKKWIRPVGYSFTGLVGLAMINNSTHWASDYPLALGLGYLCARQVSKRNIRIAGRTIVKKGDDHVSFSMTRLQNRLLPSVVYKF